MPLNVYWATETAPSALRQRDMATLKVKRLKLLGFPRTQVAGANRVIPGAWGGGNMALTFSNPHSYFLHWSPATRQLPAPPLGAWR